MNILVKVDDFLIDQVFQKFSDKFQKATGKNCYFLAKQLHLLGGMFFSLLSIREVFSIKFMAVVGVICCFYGAYYCHHLEKVPFNGFMNPNRPWAIKRIILLILYSTTSIIAIRHSDLILPGLSISLLCGAYFGDCTPFPPCQSKIKELFKKAIKAVVKIFSQPKPEPVPTK